MTITLNDLAHLDQPAWLWDFERLRIVWANDEGIRFWKADNLFDLLDRRFGKHEPGIEILAELVGELTPGEQRDVALNFASRGNKEMSTCQCRLYKLRDGRQGLLITIAKPSAIAKEDGLSPLLMEAMPMPLGIFDIDGSLLFANSAAQDLFALADDKEAVLASIVGDGEFAADLIKRTQAAGTLSESRKVETRFGTRTHHLTARQIIDGDTQAKAVLVLFDDVTERRNYEQALSANAQRLEDFVAAAADFTWETDRKLRLHSISPGFEKLIGVGTKELDQKTWNDLKATYNLHGIEDLTVALEGHKPSRSTIIWPAAAGDINIALSAVPVFDAAGAFTGYRGIGSVRSNPERTDPTTDAGHTTDGTEDPAVVQEDDGQERNNPDHAPKLPAQDPLPDNVTRLHDPGTGPLEPALDVEEEKAFHAIANALNGDTPIDDKMGEKKVKKLKGGKTFDALLSNVLTPLILHRNFELLFANQAAAELLGFKNPKAMTSNHSLLTLFPDDRSELIEWRDPIDDSGADIGQLLEVSRVKDDGSRLKIHAKLAPFTLGDETLVQMHLADAGETQSAGLDIASDISEPGVIAPVNLAPETPAPDATAEKAKPEDVKTKDAGSTESEAAAVVDLDRRTAPQGDEQELRAILDTVADGIITLDDDGRIISLNASAQAILGYDKTEITGRKLQDFMSESSAEEIDSYLASFADSGLAGLFNDGREVIAIEKHGGEIPLFLTLGRMKMDKSSKQKTAFCAVVHDITNWKTIESDLRRAKEEAENASAQKSDFLAKISHELRTPLNAIIGFSEVMSSEKFGAISNKRYHGYINDIHASGEHLLSLINDLLDLSKIEAGKFELNFTAVNLEDIVQQTVNTMQPQANRERIIIRTSLAPGLPPVVADQRSMRQIMLNLLSNAIKFTDPGGQVIVSGALEDDGEVVLRVRDTGVGMDGDEVDRALEPFRQIEKHRQPEHAGTGLGLPLTKALAEANRAQFAIESTPNVGTLIEIIFPTTRVLAD